MVPLTDTIAIPVIQKTASKSSKSVSPKNRGCPLCPPWLLVDVVGDVIW